MKTSKTLMIPFSYHTENMLDYYDKSYNDKENNRIITWDTIENYRVWQPNIRSYKYSGETEEKFIIEQKLVKQKFEEYFERIKSGRYIEIQEVIWKQNYEFVDTLKYSHYSRGRSSAKMHFISEITGKGYEMFLTDFDDVMNTIGFDKNILTATFTFCKRGANYGIKIVNNRKESN